MQQPAFQRPRRQLCACVEPELGEDPLEMRLGSTLSDGQDFSDLPIRQAQRDETGDFLLACAQSVMSGIELNTHGTQLVCGDGPVQLSDREVAVGDGRWRGRVYPGRYGGLRCAVCFGLQCGWMPRE